MNCSESDRRIYCYRELSDRERTETDEHLETCAACRATMESVIAAESVIQTWKQQEPAPSNEAQMTSRIMAAVGKEQARKTVAWHTYFKDLGMSALRYGMAATSLLLVAFFLGEYAKGSESPQIAKRYPTTGQTIEFDLASFRSAFFAAKRKEQHNSTSIFQCMRDCQHNPTSNCADCLEKYSKP